MSDTQAPQSSPAAESHADNLAALKKMSTTAGLGSGDYTAINGMAIASIILGLLSFLGLLTAYLLLLAAAAVVTGIVAIVQIRNSNGTQTGRSLAFGGIALGVLLSGVVLGRELIQESAVRPERDAIVTLIDDFGKAAISRDYQRAYDLTGPGFKDRNKFDDFTKMFVEGERLYFGKLESVQFNGRIFFVSADGSPGGAKSDHAIVGALFKFEKLSETSTQELRVSKINGKWVIEDIAPMFRRPTPQ